MVYHTFMAFLVHLQTLWIPWTIFVPFIFPRSSLKTPVIWYTQLLNPFSCIHMNITLKPTYIRMCAKGQIFLEFSLMWIWVTCILAFHMPRHHSDLTFRYPSEALYKEPFGYIEGGELKSKKTIVHCCRRFLILEYASLCPLDHLVFFPSLNFLVRFLSRDGGLRWWRPRWGTQFLWFIDVPTEVVIHEISDLY